MDTSRRYFPAALAGAVSVLSFSQTAHGKDTALPVPNSLVQAAQLAKARSQPLVLLISLPGCVYCELVRRSYLMPLLAEIGLQVWQLDVSNRTAPLIGFDGKPTTAAAQAKAWGATFTPTVLFLDSYGQELAERLVGIAVPDFYGGYLEQRLVAAKGKLN